MRQQTINELLTLAIGLGEQWNSQPT